MPLPVIAIIDVGKTNKKLLLFDEDYNIVYERSARFNETVDEDGDPCENLESLTHSVFDSLRDVAAREEFDIRAINFSAYGASFVYVDQNGKPLTPLYNYLKTYPESLKRKFYKDYGGEEGFAAATASPVLGSLNSGMQLYRLKYEKPDLFGRVRYALHLPQYLSYLLSGRPVSDITSIGCHTNLWDFAKQEYHAWVDREGIHQMLPPIVSYNDVTTIGFEGKLYKIGPGFHDSSAALIPYLVSFREPFALISSGTWCITLNPFNHLALTVDELKKDCLCYLNFRAEPVKASRLFSGHHHEEQVGRIAAYFNTDPVRYRNMLFNPELATGLHKEINAKPEQGNSFGATDLSVFSSDEEAYHKLISELVMQQYHSTQLVIAGTPVKRIFVDGGFSKNDIYMNLLASVFPGMEIYATSIVQASALGAALAIHDHWSNRPVPSEVISLKYYAGNLAV